MQLVNPYVALGAVLLLAGAYGWGRYDGRSIEIASQARTEKAIHAAAEASQLAAAAEIAKIEIRNVTIRQKAETITREVPVYRDCQHSDDGLQLVNEALAPPKPASNR